jgi:NADPH2:quinone reductase
MTQANPSRDAIEARCLRLAAAAGDIAHLSPAVETRRLDRNRSDDLIVEIGAAGINPSDVKAALGLMPHAVFPRTPGRDFAGVVVGGPQDLIGREVFGSSGDLGIRRDGTHATHLVIEKEAVVEKPAGMSLEEAAGIGVPFVTAFEGLRRAGLPKTGETVLILGLNGKVGQAAAQIAAWRGAQVIGVVRKPEPYAGHASAAVAVLDSSTQDIPVRVKELTGGRGADIVFNTVGDPYYAIGTAALAKLGRQIFIAAVKRIVEFDIFAFYRGRHTYVGVETLALSSVETADILRELVPGFAAGALKPFPIESNAVFALGDAARAYAQVLGSSRDRVIFAPGRQNT